jgi:hypothetical protein
MKCKTSGALFGILFIVSIASAAESQPAAVDSIWAAQPLKIDGSAKDWTGAAVGSWEKGGVQYAFANDASNLYVLFQIPDPKLRSTIEELGLVLRVDSGGGENRDYGIRFRRRRITANESIALLEKEGPVSDEQKSKMRATPYYNFYFAEVVDSKGDAVSVPAGVAGPPAMFKFSTEKKVLVFELMIPLARANAALAGLGAQPGATLSLGFEWGGPTEEQRKAAARQRGTQSDIANEQVTSGRGTDITAGARKVERMPEKHFFWTAVKLANQ